jgi:predicted DNA-binding protein
MKEKKYILRVPEERYKQFKKASIEVEKPMYQIINECIENFIDGMKKA